MHPNDNLLTKGWYTLVKHKGNWLERHIWGLCQGQFQVTTSCIAFHQGFHVNCFLFFHCWKAFNGDHVSDWSTSQTSISTKQRKQVVYWTKPKSYPIISMQQAVSPTITEDMKQKFWARYCYLKGNMHNSNRENNNNIMLEDNNTVECYSWGTTLSIPQYDWWFSNSCCCRTGYDYPTHASADPRWGQAPWLGPNLEQNQETQIRLRKPFC